MPTAVRRRTRETFNVVQTFREHLVLKHDAKTLTTRSDALKKRLKEWLPAAPGTYVNENGSRFVDLPETVVAGGKSYKGMELRRSVSTRFNEATAEEILREKGDAVLRAAQSSYIDQDKVHRLVAEGKISEDDLDKMFETSESFAFWPVEGEVV